MKNYGFLPTLHIDAFLFGHFDIKVKRTPTLTSESAKSENDHFSSKYSFYCVFFGVCVCV